MELNDSPIHFTSDYNEKPQFISNVMSDALEQWGAMGWTTPIYHTRAHPVDAEPGTKKKILMFI